LIEKGDIVVGRVVCLSEHALHLSLVCFDNHKKRDLTGVEYNVRPTIRPDAT
jgi:hypothetical protein